MPFANLVKHGHLLESSQDQYADRWLLLLPHRVQQRPHFWAKALVKHGVGFIQYNVLHVPKIEMALFSLLHNLLRSSHQDVQGGGERCCLLCLAATCSSI